MPEEKRRICCLSFSCVTARLLMSSRFVSHVFTPFTSLLTTHIDGAAHQRASLQGLPHDLEELFGRLGQLKELSHSACEILHGLQSVAPFKSLIGPVQPKREGKASGQCADMSVLPMVWMFHGVRSQF